MAKTEIESPRKLNLVMMIAAAINQSVEQRLVISPAEVAQMNQNSKIMISLDEQGNFVLTVKES